MKRFLFIIMAILTSCGPELENSQLLERVDTDTGVFQHDYIVERHEDISFPTALPESQLNYFPEEIGEEIISKDFFWVLDKKITAKVSQDQEKTHTDELLLSLQMPSGSSGFYGSFFHSEYDGLEDLDSWVLEFRPFLRARSISGSGSYQIVMVMNHVCYRIEKGTMTILDKNFETISSPNMMLTSEFEDIKINKTYRSSDAVNHLTRCQALGGSLSASIDIRDSGAENIAKEVQFVDLRIIKRESF